jgi:hypothetical protein
MNSEKSIINTPKQLEDLVAKLSSTGNRLVSIQNGLPTISYSALAVLGMGSNQEAIDGVNFALAQEYNQRLYDRTQSWRSALLSIRISTTKLFEVLDDNSQPVLFEIDEFFEVREGLSEATSSLGELIPDFDFEEGVIIGLVVGALVGAGYLFVQGVRKIPEFEPRLAVRERIKYMNSREMALVFLRALELFSDNEELQMIILGRVENNSVTPEKIAELRSELLQQKLPKLIGSGK